MRHVVYICLIIILASCGGTKKATNTASVEDIAAARLIENYYASAFDFNTLVARTKIVYEDKKNRQTVTANIRIEKDKKIWISVSKFGLTGAKALITPDRVSFYEKLNRSFFEGDFSFLSQYVGVDMNFDQLQRLLIGQTVYNLRDGRYTIDQEDTTYKITPKQQQVLLDLFFFVEPESFVLKKQRVVQPQDNLSLEVDYLTHQSINGKSFPQNVRITAQDKSDQTLIDIQYRSVDVNVPVRFPFSIPSGYKEIQFNARR